MKVFENLNKLFGKVDTTHEKYEQAQERQQEKLIQLELELKEKTDYVKSLHKSYLTGGIKEESYRQAEAELKELHEKVEQVKKDMGMVKAYEEEELHAVLAEMQEEFKNLSPKRQAEISRINKELLLAKKAYLEQIGELATQYSKINGQSYKIQDLQVKLGLKNGIYAGSVDDISAVSVGSSIIPLRVEQHEVFDALRKKLPSNIYNALLHYEPKK